MCNPLQSPRSENSEAPPDRNLLDCAPQLLGNNRGGFPVAVSHERSKFVPAASEGRW